RETLDVDHLCTMAEVASGQRVHDGAISNLTSTEWLERYREFRSACPDYWRYQPGEAPDWHTRRAEELEASAQWAAAIFHWSRAAAARPAVLPKLAMAHYYLGYLLQSQDRRDDAMKEYRA